MNEIIPVVISDIIISGQLITRKCKINRGDAFCLMIIVAGKSTFAPDAAK